MEFKEFKAIMSRDDDEFLKFENIEYPMSKYRDVHAFLLLEKLYPHARTMVCAAEHDQIWLAPDTRKIAKIITEEQCVELIRCGVMMDDDTGDLFMFA